MSTFVIVERKNTSPLSKNGEYYSTLLKKIEVGIRDSTEDYVKFCHWKGKKITSIERHRYAELFLLYNR